MALTLLFPPATDPRSPHLALPSLAAHLRAHGEAVTLRDLDLEAFLRTLEPANLEDAARRLRNQGPSDERSRQLLASADHLIEHAADAVATLRESEGFFDPHRHHAARARIVRALALACAATPVTYASDSATYDVAGVDPSRLTDLERVTSSPDTDLFADLHQEVLDDLASHPPELVGVSILNRQQIIPGLILSRRLKAAGHRVVIGGTVYAKFADRLRRRPRFFDLFCDFLVPYEGETALVELLGALRTERDRAAALANVPNLLWLDGDDVRAGPTHVEDVRLLPTPDFTGLPLERYLAPEPVLPILTGKGCYFNRCKFCDIPAINEISVKPYRVRDADQIAGDCATLHERFGARHFEITDETLSPKLLRKLGDALASHPDLDPSFVGYARFEPGFTAEACERIRAMGMRKLFFGLESGSQRMLDHMDKGVDVGTAREVLANCARAGIAVHVFSIIGFPEETEHDARQTLRFLLDEAPSLRAASNSFDVHPFGLDLRTDYFDGADRFGVVIDTDLLANRDFPISVGDWTNTRGLGPEQVQELLGEFGAELRERFAPERRYPASLWPGFEEYAVLYASHYEGRPWRYAFALPDPADPLPIQLRWAEGVRFEPPDPVSTLDPSSEAAAPGADVLLVTADGGGPIAVTPTVVQLLARVRPPQPVDDLLDDLLDAAPHDPATHDELRATLRTTIDELLGARVLWLDPATRPAAADLP